MALPPGGNLINLTTRVKNNNIITGVYVGSLHKTANFENLLIALNNIKKEDNLNIKIVCRQNEYASLPTSIINSIKSNSFVKVLHLNFYELKEVYENADFAIIPYNSNTYNNFAMPIKLIEYFSYGLPILCTNIKESAKFIETNSIGIITDDDSSTSLYKGMKQMVFELENNKFNRNNIASKFGENHTWIKRVEAIHNIMEDINEN